MNEPAASELVDISEAPEHRQQQLYFRELFQLKVRCEYTRRYRNTLSAWVTRIAILRAVASSGSIAGWVIWREYAFVWGAIIAASQLADALRDAIPYTARQKASNALLTDLDALFIEALFEWEGVFSAKFTNEEITERRRKLMQLQHEFDGKHFPTGNLPSRPDLLALAEQDAIAYLEAMFREEMSAP
ncbi:MAG TPA: hypothetical protein VKQ73_13285 [Stellaceae bacterium]|nr:hypothetical protein [Stellaceae bacterium]